MSILWKSPFNKVVRSTEAGLAGLLIGVLLGILFTFLTPHPVTRKQIVAAIATCDSVDNIKKIKVGYNDTLSSVTCINDKK